MKGDPRLDPKGLIEEAFKIDGITPAECRSIFLDWALSLPEGTAPNDAIRELIDRHGKTAPEDHPMLAVLAEGLTRAASPRRRGGWRARTRH